MLSNPLHLPSNLLGDVSETEQVSLSSMDFCMLGTLLTVYTITQSSKRDYRNIFTPNVVHDSFSSNPEVGGLGRAG